MLCSHLLYTLFWLFLVPSAVLILLSVRRGRDYIDYVEGRIHEPVAVQDADLPAVALIVPVKGAEPDLAANLASLASQDYPRFELVVCCADETDPALLVARSTLGPGCRIVVAGEPPPDTGEKIHNLLAAIDAVGRQSEVLAFADSDGQVSDSWLRKLVSPLVGTDLGAVTGYRWHFPDEGGFWSLLRSVWDSSVATIMDRNGGSFAWGGATAVRRDAFESARVREHWRGAVSDDLRLTAALRAAGLGIRFAPEAMVATTGSCSGGEFLTWSVRQMTITRVYGFNMWLGGCASHLLYGIGQAVCLLLALQGSFLGLGGLILLLLPGMAQGATRAYSCSLLFPDREAWLERHGWAYFWLAPLATWVWLYALLRAGLTRRISWRGRVYELRGETDAREIRHGQAGTATASRPDG